MNVRNVARLLGLHSGWEGGRHRELETQESGFIAVLISRSGRLLSGLAVPGLDWLGIQSCPCRLLPQRPGVRSEARGGRS